MSSSVSAETIDRISDCYGRGLHLQAFEASKPLGSLQELTDPTGRAIGE